MRHITKYVGNITDMYNIHWISEENDPITPHWRLETSNSEICRFLYEIEVPNILSEIGCHNLAWTPENTMGWYITVFKPGSYEILKKLSGGICTITGQKCTFAIYPLNSDIAVTLDKDNKLIEIGKYKQKIINL